MRDSFLVVSCLNQNIESINEIIIIIMPMAACADGPEKGRNFYCCYFFLSVSNEVLLSAMRRLQGWPTLEADLTSVTTRFDFEYLRTTAAGTN